jgi:ubiquinone/menaquinone biosynthesis C-methylase UbiE
MTATILLVSGGDDFAREVYAREGAADWAQAMPLVLEKLGYLDFATAGPEALADERTWRLPRVVLVARVPPEAWSPGAVALAAGGRARALIELPPPSLHAALGIEQAGPAPQDGVVAALADDLREAISASTTWSSTRLEPPQSREVPRDRGLDWDRLGVPIAPEQAERWRALGWRVERWAAHADATVLAEWVRTDGDAERWPAIVGRGRLRAACFSIFGYLGQQTTVQPFEGPEYINWPRSTALEVLLSELLDRMHQEAGIARARVLPWPDGARWVLGVRHDYDRELSAVEIDRILTLHRRAGSAATWYWRSRYLDGNGIPGSERDVVARRVDRTGGQEVAHHTEQLWRGAEEEQRAIERAIGRAVSGTCAHGDPNCFRWQGAPNLLWAERAGLSYSEFISHAHPHPHRFCALRDDGTLEHSRVLCLPHHVSLDRSMTPGDAAVDEIVAASEEYVRTGGMMQILSHPDINIEPLFELIERLPSAGRLDLTARDAADWWRRSHVRDELQIVQQPDGAVTLSSRHGVRGLTLEVLRPDGSRPRHVVEIDPGGSIVIDGPGGQLDPDRRRRGLWKRQAVPVFAEAVRGYYATQGISTSAQDVQTTIATNTELVPTRVDTISRFLRELQGVASLRGMRVLDVGGGFGAFAVYLALDPDAPLVTTVDVRPEFIDTGREVTTRLGLQNLDFKLADMRNLGEFEDAQFDLVILNNSFLYLVTKDDMRRSITELHRVIRAGGYIVFFHANRWKLREPFTRAPVVHLLPPRLADRVSSMTGWRHNHGRVLLVSPVWLGRQLRRTGFTDVKADGPGRRTVFPRAWFAKFYAVTGRKPG